MPFLHGPLKSPLLKLPVSFALHLSMTCGWAEEIQDASVSFCRSSLTLVVEKLVLHQHHSQMTEFLMRFVFHGLEALVLMELRTEESVMMESRMEELAMMVCLRMPKPLFVVLERDDAATLGDVSQEQCDSDQMQATQ